MLFTYRRFARLAAGLAAAGIATATLLAPTAAEAGVPPGTCTTQKAAYQAAADTYRQAKTALNDAVTARKTAVDAFKADPTAANRQARADAIAAVTRLKGQVAAARPAVDATYAAQKSCVKPQSASLVIDSPAPSTDLIYTTIHVRGLKSSTLYQVVPRETCASIGPGCYAARFATDATGSFDGAEVIDGCFYVPGTARNIDIYEMIGGTMAATPAASAAIDVASICVGP